MFNFVLVLLLAQLFLCSATSTPDVATVLNAASKDVTNTGRIRQLNAKLYKKARGLSPVGVGDVAAKAKEAAEMKQAEEGAREALSEEEIERKEAEEGAARVALLQMHLPPVLPEAALHSPFYESVAQIANALHRLSIFSVLFVSMVVFCLAAVLSQRMPKGKGAPQLREFTLESQTS
mmetsp:Transcript_30185/g.59094  ORF Transcript_30185/g.59094 Transcript_30185/m.59094 type:complete len:178 (-) Transcript_30185:288-821(-)|eukprot:CAMPEP_0175152034 /NCGR_PEP_ID=MMETSP0087-20121206/18872_1 /TAXON_ID=136419 /ORGANISM="Unknown Unknown, Strain D1" /LENGTH=177 /DNA_ID=CAMNT_0016438387 /DNA_START=33 /DNA_END=566 /DNA_ORIENTATION=-